MAATGGASTAITAVPHAALRIETVCGYDTSAARATSCFEGDAIAEGLSWRKLVSSRLIDLTIAIEAEGALGATHVRVAGIERAPIAEIIRRSGSVERRRFRIELPSGSVPIEISVATVDGSVQAASASVRIDGVQLESAATGPVLHILAVGIADYQLATFRLTPGIASNDAKAIASTLALTSNQAFGARDSTVLLDSQATGPAIRGAFRALEPLVKPDDIVVIFLAGHGAQLDGDYVFAPYELGYATQSQLVERARSGQAFENQLINSVFRTDGFSQTELAISLARLRSARVLVILDTCFGGSFDLLAAPQRSSVSSTITERLADISGRFVIAAARGFALDEPEGAGRGDPGHSIFTASVLRGLGGAADRDDDGKVTMAELADYVRSDLPRQAKLRGIEQTAAISFVGNPYFTLTTVKH